MFYKPVTYFRKIGESANRKLFKKSTVMAHKIVGTDVLVIDLIDAMMKSPSNVELYNKWTNVASRLGLSPSDRQSILDDKLQNKIKTVHDIYTRILEAWIGLAEERATLGDLVGILKRDKMKDIIRCIEEQFYQDQESTKQINRNPQGTGDNQGNERDRTDGPNKNQRDFTDRRNDHQGGHPDRPNDNQDNPKPILVTEEELDFIKNMMPFEVKVTIPTQTLKRIDHYKLPKRFKGFALLINITEFDDGNNRAGAPNDMKYMKDLWTQLGYDTGSSYEGRFTAAEIKDIVSDFITKLQDDEEEVKSCVAYFGSHGQHGYINASSGPDINLYKDFIYRITDLDVLKGKPKLFIVNACQVYPRTNEDVGTTTMPVKDTMVCYSTIPGHVSNRDTYLGSWYVNCLTRVLMKNAHHMDLEQMLTLTQKTMQNIVAETTEGQLPTHQNWLMEKLYFNLVTK